MDGKDFFYQLKLKLGSACLDLVEKLPQFSEGRIANLQQMRQFHRRLAESSYRDSRPPEGIKVKYFLLTMFDLFNLDSINQLQNNLFSLFPKGSSRFYSDTYQIIKNIERISTNQSGTTNESIGTLIREGSRNFLCHTRVIKELPEEVDHIDVSLQKSICSSYILLVFNVFLNSKASDILENLQSKKYLGATDFKSFFFSCNPRYFLKEYADDIESTMDEFLNRDR